MRQKVILFMGIGILVLATGFLLWGVFAPLSPGQPARMYVAPKGLGYSGIADTLQREGFIRSSLWFKAYVILTMQFGKLQSGSYELSPSMSAAAIARKLALGDILKTKVTLIEGWDVKDIGMYLAAKNICSRDQFSAAVAKDWSAQFAFLRDKPAKAPLEGYIFPDTYYLPYGLGADRLVQMSLQNFDKKLTPDLRQEITRQHKTVFEIVTMASLLEREVKTEQDKKMVAGILYKRLRAGIPLQVDSTLAYVTGKSGQKVSLADTKINSRYNTYKYQGLPPGPISNPGMDSILAAIYPTQSDYLYYLSASATGQTIFSKTLRQHELAIAKYLQ